MRYFEREECDIWTDNNVIISQNKKTWKMGKYLKIKKKMWNVVVSKPEHHNLRRKTAIKTKIEFSRKKEHSSIADTMLKVDQIKRKMEAKFNKPFFIWKSKRP